MKLVIAAVVGGLIVFVWSAVAHMATRLGTARLGPVGLLAYTAGPGEALSPRQLLSELGTSMLAAAVGA